MTTKLNEKEKRALSQMAQAAADAMAATAREFPRRSAPARQDVLRRMQSK